MTHFAAIPTTYADVQMRSRLEAKWAAFFDLCGWQWTYEPFDLPGWIPDFLIDNDTLVEIKPLQAHEVPNDVTHKINAAIQGGAAHGVVLLGNDPSVVWSRSANGVWTRQPPVDWWEPLWKKACNIVQWKSPRPPLISAQDDYDGGSDNDWEPPEFHDVTDTCEWAAKMHESEADYHGEERWNCCEKGMYEKETEAICEEEVHRNLKRYYLECASTGMLRKDARTGSEIVKFQTRASAYRRASKYIETWGTRKHESIFLNAIADSAALKANAACAKRDGRSDHPLLNATAEAAFRAAKDAYMKTDEGKTNRIAGLRDAIKWYDTEASAFIRENAVKRGRITKLEAEILELECSMRA